MKDERIGEFWVVTCSLGKTRLEWAVALSNLIWPAGLLRNVITVMGFDTCHARNVAVATALQYGVKYLMFYDDDIIPRERNAGWLLITALQALPEVDIIGGIYPARIQERQPLVFKTSTDGTWWGWEDGEIHRVYGTGTGFMALRLASFARLDVPSYTASDDKTRIPAFFANAQGDTGRVTDELVLAEHAAKADLKWYVHGGVVCDQIDLDGKWYRVEKPRVLEDARCR